MNQEGLGGPHTVLLPANLHTATVIFLHGVSETAGDHAPLVYLLSAHLPHIKWVLPTASVKPCSLPDVEDANRWFDTLEWPLSLHMKEDAEGILKARALIEDMIDAEVQDGMKENRIVLGGFSQGGALALYTSLSQRRRNIGGTFALSAWLPMAATIPSGLDHRSMSSGQFFMANGQEDPIVPLAMGDDTSIRLIQDIGIKPIHREFPEIPHLEYRSYDKLGHGCNPKEVVDLLRWLRRVVPE